MPENAPAYPQVRKSAVISPCETYRYALMRRWDDGVPLRFVMLNPSTADAELDDPTIRRCVGFARREGFAAVIVLNLYAYRTTDPKALLTCGDAVGPENNNYLWSHLTSAVAGPTPVVAAWGTNAKPSRVDAVLRLVPAVDWRCLGATKDGHPRHPLYVKGDQPLVPFAGATPYRQLVPSAPLPERHNVLASDCAVALDDPTITLTTASEHCDACAGDRS